MKNKFEKGSEWRRWDLHVHTKGTSKNDQFKSSSFEKYCITMFKKAMEHGIYAIGITDYFHIDNYIKVLDFVKTIDSCDKFSSEEKEQIRNIFVVPNVELRMLPVTDSGRLVNIHCLFNPSYVCKLENDFFGSIEYSAGSGQKYKMNKQGLIDLGKNLDSSLTTEHEQLKKGTDNFVVTHDSLQKLLDENSALKDNCIIVVSNSNNDGASAFQKHYDLFEDVDTSSLEAVRRSIYKLSHIIFSGNPNDRLYFLGKKNDKEGDVISKCGSIKPCIHGSDAHTEDDLFIPDKNRFCWIKSDLTFDGLKQILYEPNDRVYIGEEPPVLKRVKENKTKYIKSLKINNKAGLSAKKGKWFKDVHLRFNSELVAIIGNKGSGKSAISDIIGVLADTHNAGENHVNLSFLGNGKHKKFRQKGFAEHFEAELIWEDDNSIPGSLDKDIDKTKPEKVKYLPQNYFESLTNDLEEEGFEKALKEVIFLHIPTSNRYGMNTFEDLEEYKTSSILKDLPSLTKKVKDKNREIIRLEKKLHPDYLSFVKNSLEEKEKELAEHLKIKPKKVSNPSNNKDASQTKEKKEQLKKLEDLNEQSSTLESQISKAVIDKNLLLEEKEDLTQIIDDFTRYETEISEYINVNKDRFEKYSINIDEIFPIKFKKSLLQKKVNVRNGKLKNIEKQLRTIEDIKEEFEDLTIAEAKNAIKNSLVIQKQKLDKKIRIANDALTKPEQEYNAYKKSLKNWESIKAGIIGDKQDPYSKPKTVEYYKAEKSFIESKANDLLIKKRQERLQESIILLKKKKEIITLYKEFKSSIDKEISKDKEFREKFRMDVDVSFKINRQFYNTFLTFINQGKKGTFYGSVNGEKYLNNVFDGKDLTDDADIESILNTIVEYLEYDQRPELEKIQRQISDQIDRVEEFYDYIFSLDYLEPNYELKLDDKTLDELSPGEKGALLLVFYLMIDKEETPLIIDQPEDNLDNKSVFEVLTHFMKLAKKRRQIIIVTHNPNLAVGADAEQIIYVNLDKKNDYLFTYKTGSIENPEINKLIVDILEGTKPAFDKRKLKYLKD